MPSISFLLPIYNGETFLDETMQSLFAQTHDDFDIVIIDDGSTDRTAEIVKGYDDPRVKYYYKENGGLVSALNYSLDVLDCARVARIDADDICVPDRLVKQSAFMNFTQAVAVSGRAVNIDISGNSLGVSAPENDFFYADPYFIPSKEPYLPHPFMMLDFDTLKELGGYRHAHLAEDTDLCWRLSRHDRIALQSDILGQYRVHDFSISTASSADGRVQAFYSQLATLNSVRRDAGHAEISYDHTMAEARKIAVSFEALIAEFDSVLTVAEKQHISAAAVMKYLDISNWRFHKISPQDLAFARSSLADVTLSTANKEKVDQTFWPLRHRQPELFADDL